MNSGSKTPPLIQSTRECWTNIDGHRMRYLRAGQGQPLLLIHGLLGYSFSWRFTIPALANIRTVYAPDLPGTGFSDRTSKMDCSARACAKRLLQFMDQAGVDSADLLGTSHGGGVAALLATIAPQRFTRLILVAPVNPWSTHGQLATRIAATPVGTFALRAAAPAIEALSWLWLRRVYGDPRRISPGTLEGYKAPLGNPGIWRYGIGVASCWHQDLRELEVAYANITQQTLLMWGDRDLAVHPSSALELKKRIPGAKLAIFPGVGHLPYEEVPTEFNRTLRDFLT